MTLKELIDSEPANAGRTDQQVLDWLNETVSRNLSSLSGDVMFAATDGAEFAALTDLKKQLWVSFTSKDSIDPFASANVAFVQWIFGGGSTTVSDLAALRTEDVDRVTNAGISRKNLGLSLVNAVRNA